MKRVIPFILLLTILVQAKGIKKISYSRLEIAPKATFYIGEDAHFGLGGECVINPVKRVGIRLTIAEAIFGNGTQFYLNYGGLGFDGVSLDGLFYIPMPGIDPYLHGGLGLGIFDPPGRLTTHTFFSFRFGIGLNYPMARSTKLFFEPGIIIRDAGVNTESFFKLGFGCRFRMM